MSDSLPHCEYWYNPHVEKYEEVSTNNIFAAYLDFESTITLKSYSTFFMEMSPSMNLSYNGDFYRVDLPIYASPNYASSFYLFSNKRFWFDWTPSISASGEYKIKGSVIFMSVDSGLYIDYKYYYSTYIILNSKFLMNIGSGALLRPYSTPSSFAWRRHIKHVDNNIELYNPNVVTYIDDSLYIYKIPEFYTDKQIINQADIRDSAFMYCYNIREVILPKQIETIGEFCFSNCINLKNIYFSNKLILIDNFAFHNCWSLEFIEIPNTAKDIKSYAFLNCIELRYIKLPNSIKILRRGLFQQCEKLDNVVIPASVEQIDEFTFLACPNLKTLVSKNSVPPEIKKYTFDEDNKITVYVPNNSVNTYQTHKLWGKMKIKPMRELPKATIEDNNKLKGGRVIK